MQFNYGLKDPFINILSESWFGFLSYQLNQLSSYKEFITCPNYFFIQFASIIVFDHLKYEISYCQHSQEVSNILDNHSTYEISTYKPLILGKANSNFTDREYIIEIQKIINMIKKGDFYEANLTRKFFGKVKSGNAFETYKEIAKTVRVSYSAFGQLKDLTFISFSPEQFIKIKANNVVSTPIKGTLPSTGVLKRDKLLARRLKNCTKNQAENLMIVDLVRNDFAKNCITGSIKVPKLFSTEIYNNVIHMHSQIVGRLKKDRSPLELIEGAFPPGSMTGAPKRKVMEICNDIEKYSRGLYSGILGYYHPQNSLFSVVIRTLILRAQKYEFQVGGAITYDSDPEEELGEIYAKANPFKNYIKFK